VNRWHIAPGVRDGHRCAGCPLQSGGNERNNGLNVNSAADANSHCGTSRQAECVPSADERCIALNSENSVHVIRQVRGFAVDSIAREPETPDEPPAPGIRSTAILRMVRNPIRQNRQNRARKQCEMFDVAPNTSLVYLLPQVWQFRQGTLVF